MKNRKPSIPQHPLPKREQDLGSLHCNSPTGACPRLLSITTCMRRSPRLREPLGQKKQWSAVPPGLSGRLGPTELGPPPLRRYAAWRCSEGMFHMGPRPLRQSAAQLGLVPLKESIKMVLNASKELRLEPIITASAKGCNRGALTGTVSKEQQGSLFASLPLLSSLAWLQRSGPGQEKHSFQRPSSRISEQKKERGCSVNSPAEAKLLQDSD